MRIMQTGKGALAITTIILKRIRKDKTADFTISPVNRPMTPVVVVFGPTAI